MTPTGHVPMRSVHRIRDAEHRTRDRSLETGGAALLAVHPHPPAATELVTPDDPDDVVREPSPTSRIFAPDHLAVRSNRLREAMRDGAVHADPVRSLIEDELDRDNRPVADVPPDELRDLAEDVVARHQEDDDA